MTGHKRRTLSSLLIGAAIVTTGLGLLPRSGVAETSSGTGTVLLGTASAEGMRLTYTVPDFLVVSEVMDGGGPVAQSVLETGGQSTAFASLPYPGENGVSGPGLLLGLLGQSPPASYPFYVRADSTVNPDVELKDPSGSYTLHATAEAQKAVGTAHVAFGAPDQPASSAAAHTQVIIGSDGRMTVTAESIFRGLSQAEGLLTIASVESHSMTIQGAEESEPRTTTRLVVDGARVGDQAVTIGPDGVHALGLPSPVPTGGGDALNQTLAQAGLTVRTVAASPLKGGGAADTLEITSVHGLPGLPRGILRLQIGGAATAVSTGSTPGLVGIPDLPSVTPGADSEPTAPPAIPATGGQPSQAEATGGDDHGATGAPPVLSPPTAAGTTFGSGTEFSGNSQALGLFPPTSGEAVPASPAPSSQRQQRPASSQTALAPEARVLYILLAIAGLGMTLLSLGGRVWKRAS
jgi:hypothetical protein